MGNGLAEGFGSLFLLIFAAAFPIVNPAGSALIFLDMTRHAAHRTREGLARRVAFYSFLVLNVSLFIGSYVLEFFGISVPALRVAGGIVVAAAGWKFLQEHEAEGVEEGSRGDAASADAQPDLLAGEPELLDERRAGARLLDRVEVLTRHVLDQCQLERLGVIARADERRDRVEPGELRRPQAALAGDQLVCAAGLRPDEDRLEHTANAERVGER